MTPTFGNWSVGRTKSQKPRTLSPRPPSSTYAWLKDSRHSSVIDCSTPSINIVEERSMMRSGAPFITSRYRSSCGSSVWCIDTYKRHFATGGSDKLPTGGGLELKLLVTVYRCFTYQLRYLQIIFNHQTNYFHIPIIRPIILSFRMEIF